MNDHDINDPELLRNAAARAKVDIDAAEQEIQGLVDGARQCLKPVDTWLRAATREHPYLVVGSAVGMSFLTGFLMRRRAAIGLGAALGFFAGCFLSNRQTAPLWDSQPIGK